MSLVDYTIAVRRRPEWRRVRLRRQALSAGDPLQRVRGGKPLWGNGH